MKPGRFLEGIGHLKRHGLRYQLQLIYGLPGDRRESFRNSLNFAMSLDPPELAVFDLLVLPGTELWRQADALRLSYDSEPPHAARSHLSLNQDDFEYGLRAADACTLLARSRTIRFLAREPGLTFADVIDAWLEWTSGHAAGTADLTSVPGFVGHMCRRHDLPRGFYDRVAALEFA
jgi:hypothetical protein